MKQHVKLEQAGPQLDQGSDDSSGKNSHFFLSACVWASASFTTRGSSDPDTSTSERMLEWLTYQLDMAGFDHVYVYDNSPNVAGDDGTSTLESVTRLFPSWQVTRIPWKHPVCNNNKPGSRDPGERSSQYAAETSCRIRYGPRTTWLAVIDSDEYLIPQHPHASLRLWLQKASKDHPETKIWSFFQTRALPNRDLLDPIASSEDAQFQWRKKPENTYMETYNCDRGQFPKPGWAWRAQKQIFQPSYVLMHFVHYSVVTRRLLDAPNEKLGMFLDRTPRERRVDEQNQAFLLHTKTTSPLATQYWRKQCQPKENTQKNKDMALSFNNDCPIGIPFPPGAKEGSTNEEGLEYNCHSHEIVTKEIVPKLKKLLLPLSKQFHQERKAWQ